MIKYRTGTLVRHESFFVENETENTLEYIDSNNNTINEEKNGISWKWHDSELDAIKYLEIREKNLLHYLELQVIECKTRLSGIKQMKDEYYKSIADNGTNSIMLDNKA